MLEKSFQSLLRGGYEGCIVLVDWYDGDPMQEIMSVNLTSGLVISGKLYIS